MSATTYRCRRAVRRGGRVSSTGVASQLQEELPVPLRSSGRESGRTRRLSGPRPTGAGSPSAADLRRARGRRRATGPRVGASVVILDKQMGLSFGDRHAAARNTTTSVSPSGLGPAVHRPPACRADLYRTAAPDPPARPSRTKPGGRSAATCSGSGLPSRLKTTVSRFSPRGFEEAANLLGPDFDGVLSRTAGSRIGCFTQATHHVPGSPPPTRTGRTLCRPSPAVASPPTYRRLTSWKMRSPARRGSRPRRSRPG